LPYYRLQPNAFPLPYLNSLRGAILACPYFTTNNLNRDFVGTKGFSVVFTRAGIAEVERQFPDFKPYLDRALLAACNAFYLNPLLLKQGSRVDPHIDRSLRSYCKTIAPPDEVSVLYIQVPDLSQNAELAHPASQRSPQRSSQRLLQRQLAPHPDLQSREPEGGYLVLHRGKQKVGQIQPQTNTLLHFQGDLTHSINTLAISGTRLSLVCEQYQLDDKELWDIPDFLVESRAKLTDSKKQSTKASLKAKK